MIRTEAVAIVLGGTRAHIPLLEKLKSRGYKTVLVDYNENPIAKEYADYHIIESTLDKDAVLAIALEQKASLVISTSIDQANVTACYVAEKLGLPSPYSYETAISVTSKKLMKETMAANGIPTAHFVCVKSINELNGLTLKYPLVIKPIDSSGSKGVRKVSRPSELAGFFESALQYSREKEVIVEEYIDGIEVSFDCILSDGNVILLTNRLRKKIEAGTDSIQQIYATMMPSGISNRQISMVNEIVRKIAEAFKLKNTPLILQTIIRENDINVIEFAPRIGGGESYSFVKINAGVDIIDYAIDSFLGTTAPVNPCEAKPYSADVLLYSEPGLFGKIDGYQSLLDDQTIVYLSSYKNEGMQIQANMASMNRVGVFFVVSDTKKGLHEKIQKAILNIQILDINGRPIMKKKIYQDLYLDENVATM